VGNSRRVLLTIFAALFVGLQATCAFASGNEGAAMVEPARWIVLITLGAFAILVLGGGILGVFRASQGGESILKGGARGVVKGLVAFVIFVGVSIAIVTLLGFLWIVYAFLNVGSITPSSPS